jgi:uncharacterized Tic20 family protein
MYELTLSLHSLLRWVVLVTALLAVGRALAGWLGAKPWTPADQAANRWFVLAITVQFVVGVLLWAGLSPYGITSAMSDMAATMRDSTRRFWAVEHFTLMLIALALVHVGAARARRGASDVARHRVAAITFLLATALVLAGIPWVGADARPLLRLGM